MFCLKDITKLYSVTKYKEDYYISLEFIGKYTEKEKEIIRHITENIGAEIKCA